MKVIVGIDGSERSYHALRFVSGMLSPGVDDLLLYHSPPKFRLDSKSKVPKSVVDDAPRALSAAVFEHARSQLSAEMQRVTRTIQGDSNPAEGILAAAENETADLIVVGAHGAVHNLPLFFGGTARKVAHLSRTPILVVRQDIDPKPGEMRILFACDEKRWLSATKLLREFSWPNKTDSTLFHVVEALDVPNLMLEPGNAFVPHAQQLIKEYKASVAEKECITRDELQEATQTAITSVVRDAKVDVVHGHAVEQILRKVEQDKPDLVVVGARRLGPMGRLLGSTTEALLTRCPSSLLIVHEHAKA